MDQNFHDSLLPARHFYIHTLEKQVSVMLTSFHH